MNNIQLAELLNKYMNGTCTPEELAAINKWYDQYQDDAAFIETLPTDRREMLKGRMLGKVMEHVNAEATSETKDAVIRPITGRWYVKLAAAAVLLVALKIVLPDSWLSLNKQTVQAEQGIHIVNNTKNILKQVLPDSSVVWLSPAASMDFPKQFAKASRNVVMTGEAFFEVTKNPQRPFIISSEHIVTKVWGTSFRVADGSNIANAVVTVVTGKVSVSKKGSEGAKTGATLANDEVLLLPAQQVTYSSAENKLTTQKAADVSDLNLYKHISLNFDNAKLTDIVAELNRKFSVNIKIQSEELNKAVMNADLTDLNLPEVLEVLKTSMQLNYEISNNSIVLKKNQLIK